MSKAIKALRIIAGATLFALALFIVLAAPGFLEDSSSTVPIGSARETGR
jgi:hypothetical protein